MSLYNVGIKFTGIDNFSNVTKKLSKSLDDFERKSKFVNKSLTNISDRFSKLGRSLTTHLTLPLIGLATYAIKNADNFEKLENQLRATMGSASGAKRVMEEITKFSLKAPFSVEEITNSTKALVAARVPVQDLSKYLNILGNISAGSGQSLELLTGQLVRMKSGQRQLMIMTQLERMGIPLKAELLKIAKLHGVSEAAFNKAAKSGRLGFNIIMQGYDALMVKYAGSMIRQSKTVEGAMTIAHNIMRVYAKDLGDALDKNLGIKNAIGDIVDVMSKFEPKFKKFLEGHPGLFKILIYLGGIFALLGPITYLISLLIKMIMVWRTVAIAAATFMAAPFIFVSAAAAAAIYAIKQLIQLVPTINFGKAFSELGTFIKHPVQSIQTIMGNQNIAATGAAQSSQTNILLELRDKGGFVENVYSNAAKQTFNKGNSLYHIGS